MATRKRLRVHYLYLLFNRCHRQFLPVFAAGVDPMTEYEESLTACLPGF